MSTWPVDDPELERRIARMERRGRRLGLIAIELAFAFAIVGIWTWALTTWPVFDYSVFPSLLPTYGLIGLAASIGLWFLLRRRTGARLAALIVGLMVAVGGLGLGLIPPIPSGGQSGWCRTVFRNVGLHGDDREDCFDARAARADDVATVVTLGLLVTAVSVGLVAEERSRDVQPRPVTPAPGSYRRHDQRVLEDASDTI